MDEMTRKGQSDAILLLQIMMNLPIYATRIGYRDNSNAQERKLADALFDASKVFQEAMK